MLWKKIAVLTAAGAALATAAPAFADPPYWAPAHGWRAKHHREVVVVQHRPYYVARRVYVQAPVVVAPPVYYAPAPAYGVVYGGGLATVGGALAGAIIGNQFGHGDGRIASTVIGASVGALVGSQLDYRY